MIEAPFIRLMMLVCALAANLAVAQGSVPVHAVDGSFIREWIVLGPFPSKEIETDFLARVGGEATIRPKKGETVTRDDGTDLVWKSLNSNYDVVDLSPAFDVEEWAVAYAYCELVSTEGTETDVRFSSHQDRPLLWLNGRRLHPTPVVRRRQDESTPIVPIELDSGRNSCLIKIGMTSRKHWEFSFQPLPPERAHLDFHVRRPDGQPVSSALIQVYNGGKRIARLPANREGWAETALYPLVGTFDFRFTAGERGTWLQDIVLHPSKSLTLDVELKEAVSISGRVLAMDQSPQDGIVVQALRVSDKAIGSLEGSSAAPVLPDLTSGPWIVSSNSGGFGVPVERIPSEDGRNRSLIPMPAFSETVHSDSDGNFRFVNLLPGQYHLRAHGAHAYFYPDGEGEGDLANPISVEAGLTDEGTTFTFAEARKGIWKRYPIRQGLVETLPSGVVRTPDGMVWAGTYEGSLRGYDGVEFTSIPTPEASGKRLQAMKSDSEGNLWIGTELGINQLKEQQIHRVAFNDAVPFHEINSIETSPDGAIWLGTASGLYRREGEVFVESGLGKGDLKGQVSGLLRTRDGGLWMCTDRSLAFFDGITLSEPVMLSGLTNPSTEKMYQAKDGALWFCSPGHETAVYRYDGTSILRLGEKEGLPSGQIWDIDETSDGVFWFGTAKGLSRFDGQTVVNFTPVTGGESTVVHDIFVDSDDVLWCTGYGGIYRFDPNGFRAITSRDGLVSSVNGRSPGIFVVEPNSDGGYLVGTEWAGVFQIGVDRRQWVAKPAFLKGAYVRHIQRSLDGGLWLGTSKGIFKKTEAGVSQVLKRPWIIGFDSDLQGNLWYGQGWVGGGLSRFNSITGEETVFELPAEFPNQNVWSIETGRKGEVWIGTDAGLAKFQDGKIAKLDSKLGLPSETAVSLTLDENDFLWVGGGMGLFRLEGTNAVSTTPEDGIAIDDFWCNAHTTGDIVWIGTGRNGLLGSDGFAMTSIDKRDGLLGNRVATVTPDEEDSLLLGFGEGGFSHYRRTKTPPSVRFMEVKINDQTLTDYSNLPSTETGSTVQVRFQEIDLKTHPEKRQFRYKVEGPSGAVLFAGLTRERQFDWTLRHGGEHLFEVQAIDRDLNYSAPARLTIHAIVPWYANAWITVPGFASFVGLTVWAFVARAIYLRQRREAESLRDRMLLQERQARQSLEEKTEQLKRAKEEADSANHAKSLFLANMSHEIRTPLNAILGYAQILRRKPDLPEEEFTAVKTIENSGDHLLTLINGVLDLSKIEAGGMEIARTDFDLRDVIHAMDAMFSPRCREKDLRFEVEWDPESQGQDSQSRGTNQIVSADGPIPVNGDEGKLRQVLINLLGNAVKFTDSGSVRLKVIRKPALLAESDVTFEIIDTGPGIPPGEHEKIFAPFVRSDERGEKGGTGLGLSISRRLVQLMEGTINLRSEIGKGSTFHFTVPLEPLSSADALENHAGSELREPLRLKTGFTVNALIVDDVQQNRDVLSQILVSLGCTVRSAPGGQQALELIQAEIPNIVFSDIRMPEMDGFELRSRIVERFGEDRMSIVAISASVLAHEQENYLKGGFQDFIGKPFRVSRIGNCLIRLLKVEFEYESMLAAAPAATLAEKPEFPGLVLPEALLKRLRESAEAHRMMELRRCLAEVRQFGDEGKQLAAFLEALNHKGEMGAILSVLEGLD